MGEVCNNAGCFNSGMVSTLKTGLVLQPCRMWFIDFGVYGTVQHGIGDWGSSCQATT